MSCVQWRLASGAKFEWESQKRYETERGPMGPRALIVEGTLAENHGGGLMVDGCWPVLWITGQDLSVVNMKY